MFETKKQPIYEILLSVVISTRDRPGQVKIAVKSVLECFPKNCELTIVDQSEDDDTAAGLSPYKADCRFTYIRSRRSDVSAGRNKGLRRAGSKWIFITDDDCEIYLDTFTAMLERLRSNQYVGIVFCNVFAEPYNSSAGIIPTYIRKRPFLARNIRDKMNIEGLSACMVIRKSAGEDLNGFDELLGTGASLKSGAETDFTIRCFLAGHPVTEIPEIRVIHHGFSNWEQCHMLAH
jgi:glycosyltransferase involved in cell wall biosynthesis